MWKELEHLTSHAAPDASCSDEVEAESSTTPPAAAEAAAPDLDALLLRATRALQIRDWAAATRLTTRAIEAAPLHFLAYDLRALCALHRRDAEAALSDALAVTALRPGWARGWARLGAAQLCGGHPRAAAAAYGRGLRQDPGSREMRAGLALAQAAAEEADRAAGGAGAGAGGRRAAERH